MILDGWGLNNGLSLAKVSGLRGAICCGFLFVVAGFPVVACASALRGLRKTGAAVPVGHVAVHLTVNAEFCFQSLLYGAIFSKVFFAAFKTARFEVAIVCVMMKVVAGEALCDSSAVVSVDGNVKVC
ncbi:hypothetical protein TNCV_4693181 [Trichonephila clavipes]|nr:hypothetical protein TNCV_4693181 [Trichonephila clavipes]